jgi:exodeoxyribonuclease-1
MKNSVRWGLLLLTQALTNMENTFFWHDYETFGINPRSDRPAQFAGVRTDFQLKEIDKPVMIYCKPTTDMLPHPQSCLITSITPQHCHQYGVTEREFATIIEKEFSHQNTINVGFNNIRFDDEVTRYLFWRNLIDPYAREWKNGCSRWDLIDVVRALYALKPHALTWPTNNEGLPSFKLEELSKANGLVHEEAHDALSDVRATIALARLIQQAEPRFFDFCLKLRNKDIVRSELSLTQNRPILHVSGMYGAKRAFLAIVWPLAMHPTNKNEVIVWDLQTDPSVLETLSVEQIKSRLFVRTDELASGVSRLPIKTICLNKSPFVVNDLRVLTKQRIAALDIDLDKVLQHAEMAKNIKIPASVWQDVYSRHPFEPLDVDEDLYGGFIPDLDRSKLDALRKHDSGKLPSSNINFNDHRLNELFFRYRARNHPESLTTEELIRWKQVCANKINPKLTGYWDEFQAIYATATESQKQILNEVRDWVELSIKIIT